ncbi:MAG: nuclear transport factor 2 family protein [Phycisphaerales bacterium]|nr:MAG: nuclear transport factor 2 family protein [Phycisphaerales bacterium]
MARAAFVALLPIALFAAGTQDVSEADAKAIKETALDYGMGWYEGDGERMERALHPDLAKRALFPDPRAPGKGKLDNISAMGLVQATRKGYGKATPEDQRRTDVTILDVFGNTASVKMRMHDWVDYMHMVKSGGRWKIVNVLWEMSPEAKKKYGIPEEL